MSLVWLVMAAILVPIIMCFGFLALASLRQGYSWQEMDWHERGSTSISDFFAAADIGKLNVTQKGKPCIEYYAYKDGLPVKTVCPK